MFPIINQPTNQEPNEGDELDREIEQLGLTINDITSETPTALRNRIRAKHVIQRLHEKTPYYQIAAELGISRQYLHGLLSKNPHFQELVIAEITEHETQLQQWITENLQSNNPANQRQAATELGRMIRHTKDKIYPTILKHENLNLNIDLTPYQAQQQLHEETLARLPPNIRDLYFQTQEQIKREWKWQ